MAEDESTYELWKATGDSKPLTMQMILDAMKAIIDESQYKILTTPLFESEEAKKEFEKKWAEGIDLPVRINDKEVEKKD